MSLTLKQMENIVNYHDKYPNRKRVCREFKDMRKVPLYCEYIKNGGTKRQQMEKIDELVYERYSEARKKFMPVHSIDLKRWPSIVRKTIHLDSKPSILGFKNLKRDIELFHEKL